MSSRLELVAQHTAAELRRLARHENDRRAAMRMIALAETMDGADRETAARRGDMSDQALRDAIKRYNGAISANWNRRYKPSCGGAR